MLRKAEGETTYQALIDANHARLRPILMTTLVMVIGMLPIALAKGAGGEWKNGLARVIIGGLVSSLFLTLVVVAVMYAIFDKLINKFSKKKKQPIEELMVEDYEPQEFHEAYEEVEFNPSHA
jgi:HAE1 family hydrophobic/amphiphilic exporter-1